MIAYPPPFFSYYSGSPLKAIAWVLVCMLPLAVTMLLDVRSALGGIALLGVLHPVWVSMRLSGLAVRNKLVYDSHSEQRTVYVQGIPVSDTVSALRNVFFYSAEDMRDELTRFACVRFLLCLVCMGLAVRDLLQGATAWQRVPDWQLLAPVMAGGLLVFVAWRARCCFALWQQGLRRQWQVGVVSLDGVPASAAYVSVPGAGGGTTVPYLEALLTPRGR